MSPDEDHATESVASLIRQLVALEASDPRTFALSLEDAIMEPVAEETEAFRSEELAAKSLAAARYLLERNEEQIARHKRARDMGKVRGANAYKTKVQYEARILDQIVKGLNAKRGILTNSPNPVRRAERRLRDMAVRNETIVPGTWARLVEEEREKDRARKKKAQNARRAQRGDRT